MCRIWYEQDFRGQRHEKLVWSCMKCGLGIEKHPDDMTGVAWDLEQKEPQCLMRQVSYVMES